MAWLPMTMIESCALISVAARIVCSRSARRKVTCAADCGQALLVAQGASEWTDLAQIHAVLIAAQEDID
jgi:hypothetical protein